MPRRKGKIVLSWATLYRWEKSYEEQGRAGLAGNYSSPSTTSVPEHMQTFIQSMIVDHPHVSIPSLMQAIKARFPGQAIPGDSAVRRYVNRWKQENASLTKKWGRAAGTSCNVVERAEKRGLKCL